MTGTSVRTPTVVANAAGEVVPNNAIATATANSKKNAQSNAATGNSIATTLLLKLPDKIRSNWTAKIRKATIANSCSAKPVTRLCKKSTLTRKLSTNATRKTANVVLTNTNPLLPNNETNEKDRDFSRSFIFLFSVFNIKF